MTISNTSTPKWEVVAKQWWVKKTQKADLVHREFHVPLGSFVLYLIKPTIVAGRSTNFLQNEGIMRNYPALLSPKTMVHFIVLKPNITSINFYGDNRV